MSFRGTRSNLSSIKQRFFALLRMTFLFYLIHPDFFNNYLYQHELFYRQ